MRITYYYTGSYSPHSKHPPGYRFLLAAQKTGKRVAILNIGETRGDNIADIKVSARCGEFFERFQDRNLWQTKQ